MYIKFLAHGKGDPSKAAAYLIDEVDHLNITRADVQVLRGDPHTFTAIAESIENQWKYTSGVIAWSKDDAPTNDEINEVLDTFEAHAFAGLQPNQYHFTAVLHEENDGSKHVHFLVPRLELETGKALNIAPPGNQKYFDPLRDYFNYSKGWSRPDDPALQRDTQTPDHIHFQDKSAVKSGLKDKTRTEVNEFIGVMIEQRIKEGYINDRADVLNAILDYGRINRISEKYIAFQPYESEKITRLKGAFYESNFSIESYIEDRARTHNDAGASRENTGISAEHRKLAEQFREQFKEFADKRSKYNANRYYTYDGSQAELGFNPVREQEFSSFNRETDTRNSKSFDPTGAAAQAAKSTVRSLEQYEPRDSRNSKDQENPFYVKYNFSFDSSYFAYIEYQSRLRQQEQIQRHHRDGEQSPVAKKPRGEPEYSEVWDREKMGLVRPDRPESAAVQQQYENSAGNQLNESRSTVIADYRAATAAAQRATETARASLTAYSGTEQNHRRIRELQQQTSEALQPVERERKRADQYHQETTESEVIRGFITKLGEQLKTAITEPFRAISDWVKSKERDQRTIANDDLYRNREADSTIDPTTSKETRLSATVSRKIRGFDQGNIFKALDELDRRRELQPEQQRKNDRGYDSPSPF